MHATKLGPRHVEPPTQWGWLLLLQRCNAATLLLLHSTTNVVSTSKRQAMAMQPTPPPNKNKNRLTDVPYLVARILPPMTAMPVHKECPITPPAVTPKGSFVVANAIVAICERSPHSAKKVIVNDIVITYKKQGGDGRTRKTAVRTVGVILGMAVQLS